MNYSFDKEHAIKYGVDEAIMLHNMIFWIDKNRANSKHFYEDRYWTYNSVEAFKQLFEFWTAKQLRRIIESLVNQKVIIRGNFNKSNMDRTGWYALVNQDALLGIYHSPNQANEIVGKGEAIPYSKQDDKPLPEGKEVTLPFSDSELKKKRMQFIKPSLQEIKLIIKDEILAQKFLNHYDGNGWKIGRTKMVDWKSTAHNWVLNIDITPGKAKIDGVKGMMENYNYI